MPLRLKDLLASTGGSPEIASNSLASGGSVKTLLPSGSGNDLESDSKASVMLESCSKSDMRTSCKGLLNGESQNISADSHAGYFLNKEFPLPHRTWARHTHLLEVRRRPSDGSRRAALGKGQDCISFTCAQVSPQIETTKQARQSFNNGFPLRQNVCLLSVSLHTSRRTRTQVQATCGDGEQRRLSARTHLNTAAR